MTNTLILETDDLTAAQHDTAQRPGGRKAGDEAALVQPSGRAPRLAPSRPVFVDVSGRRRRRVRRLSHLLVMSAAGYLAVLTGTALVGPTVNAPLLPTAHAPHQGTSPHGPVRASGGESGPHPAGEGPVVPAPSSGGDGALADAAPTRGTGGHGDGGGRGDKGGAADRGAGGTGAASSAGDRGAGNRGAGSSGTAPSYSGQQKAPAAGTAGDRQHRSTAAPAEGRAASPSPTQDPAPSHTDRGQDGGSGRPPHGFQVVRNDRLHFSIAMPEDWKMLRSVGQDSGAVYGASRDGSAFLEVDYTSSPNSDAEAAWRKAEPAVRDHSTHYRRIGIDTVRYRDYPTAADWIFERDENGERVRVLDRGFTVDGDHGYAIRISCAAGAWNGKECESVRKTALETFKPLD